MSRNLYLGADLAPVFTATSLPDLAVKAAQVWATVQANDFPARAKALAREIKEAGPVLIGVQEASLWRRGEPGVLDGPGTPATTVVADYLTILLRELAAAGAPYRALVEQFTSDGEVPTSLGYDLRLTQRNAILARADLPLDRLTVTARSGLFRTNLTIPTVAGPITDARGWTAVDITLGRLGIRFINTHLDSTNPAIAADQAQELLSGPANTRLPVVLVGDLNNDPREPGPSAYAALIGGGFVDIWTRVNGPAVVPTCCHAEDLRNVTPAFTRRLDYILTRPRVPFTGVRLVGTDPTMRTPAGLWPSDHAGVIAAVVP
jgi:hypothetical protein